jgi:hypothetical protein
LTQEGHAVGQGNGGGCVGERGARSERSARGGAETPRFRRAIKKVARNISRERVVVAGRGLRNGGKKRKSEQRQTGREERSHR